jgi:protein-S-isoprenylcysteine O-methyltransferase Ste14
VRLRAGAIALSLTWLALVGGAMFFGAGTTAYWQGWSFLGVCAAGGMLVSSVVLRDRDLMQRRMDVREREPGQLAAQIVVMTCLLSSLALSIAAHRLGWAGVPAPVCVIGDAVVGSAFLVQYLTLRENRFASTRIEVAPDQKVVSSGIYARIRHPWYAGLLLLFCGMPLALGSFWGLLFVIPVAAVLVWRIFREERFLGVRLAGYADYQTRVRWRLLPNIF